MAQPIDARNERQVEVQKEDMTTLQERQRDLFDTIKSLEKDIQVRSLARITRKITETSTN